jgi:hypothetical protein
MMMTDESVDLPQILADLEYVKGRGCPLQISNHARLWLGSGVGGGVQRNEVQATIMEIMGWWARETQQIHNVEPCWLNTSKWRIRLESDLMDEPRCDTPFAAHAAVLRAIVEALE